MNDFVRLMLVGGPFDGHEVGRLLPGVSPPAQVAWSGWTPDGPSAWLHEWRGERTLSSLIYRPVRRLYPPDIPPAIAELVEMWADSAAMIVEAFDVPAELLWPGL